MNRAPYAGILCPIHGAVDIDVAEYDFQMSKPNSRWVCPICRNISIFDDERFEEIHPEMA